MIEHWFLNILQQYGLPMGLVAFFIWRDWKREKSMTSNINELNREMRDVLKDLVTKCTAALVENTIATRTFCEAINKIPCFNMKECPSGKSQT